MEGNEIRRKTARAVMILFQLLRLNILNEMGKVP
jgi:hypothetical protein